MSSCSTGSIRSIRALVPICLSVSAAMAQTATSRIVSAAKTFVSTLDEKQRQKVLFAFDDDQQRKRWSNLPTGAVPRGGIGLKDMTPAQRSAAMALVASALSQRGFEKVQQIMDGDEVNKVTDKGPQFGRGQGGPPPGGPPPGGAFSGGPPPGGPNGPRVPFGGNGGQMFGKDLYYISIL